MRRNALCLAATLLASSLLSCGGQRPACSVDSDCAGLSLCQSGSCEAPVSVDSGVRADAGGGELCTPGTVCRAKTGDCDVAEQCPSSGLCPVDALITTGTICRAPGGDCDVAERCDGTTAACPADALSAQGTSCRAVAGTCDVEERCNGVTAACPSDQFLSAATLCRASAGSCDLDELCAGSSGVCPTDAVRAPGFSCRPASSSCDAEEVCNGAATSCPPDAVQPGTMQCAPQSCASGVTTPARFCAGGAPTCSASASPIPCNGYQCSGQTCGSSCTTSADCLSTHFCQSGGLCAPRRVDGQPCTSAASGGECSSGTCLATYADNDGDGFGAGAAGFSCGANVSSGRSLTSTDCCDMDMRAFPGASAYQTTARVSCGGFDFNCDGQNTLEFVQTNACQATACGVACFGNPGWVGNNPACGTVANFVTSCATQLCLPSGTTTRCNPVLESRAQSCR